MSVDIRLPSINAKTEAERQIKSYLIQLAEQLQWALKNVDASNNTVAVTPTPRSLISSSQTSGNAETTFGSIKALIIKSADIVNAYYEEMNKRLEGVYVAESDFGSFAQYTSQGLTESSTEIESIYENMQVILSDIEDIEHTLGETSAHIKSGLLYYDDEELPVYGLEIGQKNNIDGEEVFNKYARFTSGRLSFYDQNDVEVAYISDYKLYITNAEITGSLKLGGYIIDTTDGLAFKWAGRS